MINNGRTAFRAFSAIWRRTGRPTLQIIRPISAWTLPANTVYNAQNGHFINTNTRTVQRVDWQNQPVDEERFIPLRGRTEMALDVPGRTMISLTDVQILWSADAEANVKVGWGVAIGGRPYTIKEWHNDPIGVTNPSYIVLSLTEKNYAGT